MTGVDCGYCREWNAAHPDEPPRAACGPCEGCGRPGHVGAHPRQPCSVCLCPAHWAELTRPGWHFDLSQGVAIVIVLIVAAIAAPAILRGL